MPDPGMSLALHLVTLGASLAGMGWLALAMEVHARQAWGARLTQGTVRALRALGGAALLAALIAALAADHASMAVLVWVMALAGAALAVAFVLAWRPHWLRWLAPWIRLAPGTGPAAAVGDAAAGSGGRRGRAA